MTMDLKRFREFCAHESSTIVAHACRDESRSEVFACSHELGDQPLGEDELVLKRLDPAARKALGQFYSEHASAALFIVDFKPGIWLAPPSEWESLAAEVDDWWRDAAADMEDDERMTLESAVPFGRIPNAATYFLLPLAGSLSGNVVMFCHDGLELIKLADSVTEFLEAIPEHGIEWISADVRYIPGDRLEQFFPVTYRKGE